MNNHIKTLANGDFEVVPLDDPKFLQFQKNRAMITLSCGHREDDFDKHYSIMTKEWSRENTKAISYQTVCYQCMKSYEEEGTLLRTDEDAMEWLS